jgi:hypothetical protein
MDIGVDVEVTDARSPAQIVAERLARLAAGATVVAGQLAMSTSIQDADVTDVTPEDPKIFTPLPAAAEEPEVVESQEISAEELEEL